MIEVADTSISLIAHYSVMLDNTIYRQYIAGQLYKYVAVTVIYVLNILIYVRLHTLNP